MDYRKFKYEQSKREKEARKNQRVINVKEIRMNPAIDEHDLQVRTRNALRFLQDGDKVKVSIRFRGRQMAHTKLGEEVLNQMIQDTKEQGVVEKSPKMEGRNMAWACTKADCDKGVDTDAKDENPQMPKDLRY